MDWAEMLERMYVRWATNRGFSSRVLSRAKGEEAGIKYSELELVGRFAYGYLKGGHSKEGFGSTGALS